MHFFSPGDEAIRKRVMVFLLTVLHLAALNPAWAEQLKMAASLTLPPFIFAESDSGIDLEIVKEALALKGYTFKPVYVVFGRTAVDLTSGKVDGALTVTKERGLDNVFLSDQYICYQNVVVSLKGRGFQIESVRDLTGKRIVAFQDAAKILGQDFAAAAAASPSYYEIPDQENQVALLFKNRTDVAVMD
ncbi:MAG: transporter substrate-binding domain-containing protein, partial [Desulforhabdus sp.]|nr:transporter substrate-binding domain-containing protein [Desulforhabdus sp.]